MKVLALISIILFNTPAMVPVSHENEIVPTAIVSVQGAGGILAN